MLNVHISDSIPVSCYGYSDGSITATASGGTPPYTYHWDDPAATTNSSVTGLMAGILYKIVVNDINGCVAHAWIDISEPGEISFTAEYSDTICTSRSYGYINITASGGILPYTYSWLSGETTQNISGLDTGTYTVTIRDDTGCEKQATFVISALTPFEDEELCLVSADPQTGNNIVFWEKTYDTGTDSFYIYRENNLIGTVDINDPGVFMDTVADPEKRQYLYYISALDTCGNESGKSPFHKPLFLQVISSTATGVSLEWQDYEDEDGNILFNSYTIYRGTDSIEMQAIEDDIPVQVHAFTDNNPDNLKRKYFYRIAGILNDVCTIITDTGSVSLDYSLSNYVDNGYIDTGIPLNRSKGLSIYPNPFTGKTTIEFPNSFLDPYRLIVRDIQGKILKSQHNIKENRIILDCSDLSPGLYFIELRGSGTYRGKIVIE